MHFGCTCECGEVCVELDWRMRADVRNGGMWDAGHMAARTDGCGIRRVWFHIPATKTSRKVPLEQILQKGEERVILCTCALMCFCVFSCAFVCFCVLLCASVCFYALCVHMCVVTKQNPGAPTTPPAASVVTQASNCIEN